MTTGAPIQLTGVGSKYAQVADVLRGDIAGGALSVGDMIPTEAEIGQRFGVSRITVRSALQCLEQDGLITREQGRGTFVARPRATGALVANDLTHVLFLLVDVSAEAAYNYREIATTERFLSARGIPFSWAALSGYDLVSGRFPTVLERGLCRGVILDGHVRPSHFALGERFGVKVLAVGNHDLPPELPQVRIRVEQAVRTVTRRLGGSGARRVCLAVEPMQLAFSHEVLRGYTTALDDLSQDEQLVYLCPGDAPPTALATMLKSRPEGCAVVTTESILPRVLDLLRDAGVDPARIPMAVTASRPLNPAPGGLVYQLNFRPEPMQTLAAERLLDLIEGRCETVYEELDLDIVPPQAPAGVEPST